MPRRVNEERLRIGRRRIGPVDEVQLRVVQIDLTDVLRTGLVDVVRARRPIEPLVEPHAGETQLVRLVLVIQPLRTALAEERRAIRVVREDVLVLAQAEIHLSERLSVMSQSTCTDSPWSSNSTPGSTVCGE